MLIHEFIPVSEVPESINYNDYSKDQMTLISDEFILANHEPIRKVEMYCQNLAHKIMGLDYHGITILDNQMAKSLKRELLAYCKKTDDLEKLTSLLEEAVDEKKYIIHFGI